MCPDKDALYWDLNEDLVSLYRRNYWWLRCWLAGTLKAQQEQQRISRAKYAEVQIADLIRDEYGYQVHPTTVNCPFDLYVSDGNQAARVEVKLSTYHRHPSSRGGRYQVDVHQSQLDLLIWICRSSSRDWYYLVPAGDLRGRRNLAIWSQDPGQYRGQWSPYLNAWHHLEAAVTNAARRVWQFSLTVPGGRVC